MNYRNLTVDELLRIAQLDAVTELELALLAAAKKLEQEVMLERGNGSDNYQDGYDDGYEVGYEDGLNERTD